MYSEAVASRSRQRLLLLLQNPRAGASGESRALTPLHIPSPFLFLFQETKPHREAPVLSQTPFLLHGDPSG